MTWTPVTTDAHLQRYQTLLDNERAYDGSSVELLRRLQARGDSLWLYDDGSNQVALCCGFTPARIINAVCHGPATGKEFCDIVMSQVRPMMKVRNITSWRTKSAATYSTREMRDVFTAIEQLPEIQSPQFDIAAES